MRPTLHIVNGDSTANGLRRSGLAGRIGVWAEVLHEGPIPLEASPDQWRDVRARFYEGCGWGTYQECLDRLREWDQALEWCAECDEVVLWFECDLFDQLLLINLLDRLSQRDLGAQTLSLVCIDRHPGVERFVGLGQLEPDQLCPLINTRQHVSAGQLELARAAWRAFRGPDPTAIEVLVASNTSALPFLAGALVRHLEEFPCVRNGLGRTENQTLAAAAARHEQASDLFQAVQDMEEHPFLGDAAFWLTLKRLAGGREPLLTIEAAHGDKEIRSAHVALTEAGRRVLQGRGDWITMCGIDRWLGGVHLQGTESPWRWDERERRLVATPIGESTR